MDAADDFLEIFCTLVQQLSLSVIDIRLQLALDAVGADDIEHAQANVVNAEFSVKHGGNGQRAIQASEDAFANVAGGPEGKRALDAAIKVLAMTGLDMMTAE